MNILIPMAGEGSRFSDVGYKVSKPLLPTYDRKSNKELPMVVCAANNLYGANNSSNTMIFIDRDFHKSHGVEDIITLRHFYRRKVACALRDGWFLCHNIVL